MIQTPFITLFSAFALLFITGPGQAQKTAVNDSVHTILPAIRGVLSVYPDLATGNINIKWENQPKAIANVVIMDAADKEVLVTNFKISTPAGQTKIDLSTLAQGEYTITINSENIAFTGKLSVLP